MLDGAYGSIAVLIVILLCLMLGAMSAGIWTWTQRGWQPRSVPVIAVLSVGLIAVISLVSGAWLLALLLAGVAWLWASWIAGEDMPNIASAAARLRELLHAAMSARGRRSPTSRTPTQGQPDRSPARSPAYWNVQRGQPAPSTPTPWEARREEPRRTTPAPWPARREPPKPRTPTPWDIRRNAAGEPGATPGRARTVSPRPSSRSGPRRPAAPAVPAVLSRLRLSSSRGESANGGAPPLQVPPTGTSPPAQRRRARRSRSSPAPARLWRTLRS